MESQLQTDTRPLVAMAGASGFVGTHLRHHLQDRYRFRALTRSAAVANAASDSDSTQWERCDLYSLPGLTKAMTGCKLGVYLVHSMSRSSRLVQARFEDTDLILADNFIRAAEAAGVEHVIYLSGLMPEQGEKMSQHLLSRLEVERVLSRRSVRLTVLRAGLIFGPGGSSFSILINLVRRLPFMILPRWANATTQSIDVENVCQAFELCFTEKELSGVTCDLGGHQAMTYRSLLLETARFLDKRVRALSVPVNCFALSRLWVALLGGVPVELAGPLQESLRHHLRARPNLLLEKLENKLVPLQESFRRAVDEHGAPKPNPRSVTRTRDAQDIKRESRVLSVQRLPLPQGLDAPQVAAEYGSWLSDSFGGLLDVKTDSQNVIRFLAFGKWKLLELTPTPFSRSSRWRCAFYITGGWLSRQVEPKGRLEFRLFPENDCLIAAIMGFAPKLPWYLYRPTQAVAHLLVMKRFAAHLIRKFQKPKPPAGERTKG